MCVLWGISITSLFIASLLNNLKYLEVFIYINYIYEYQQQQKKSEILSSALMNRINTN